MLTTECCLHRTSTLELAFTILLLLPTLLLHAHVKAKLP